MRFVREVIAWLSVPLLCVLGLILCIFRPFNPDNTVVIGRVIAISGRAILGMRRPVEGRDNIPRDRPTILIANHQHNDDLFVLADLLPPRTVAVGKASLGWVPFFGQVFWLGGNIMINRGRSGKAMAMINASASAMTNERKSIWIFPEGTRSHGKGLQAFKKGAFHAAVAAGAPITPVCVAPYNMESKGWLGRRLPVKVRILPPIETASLKPDDIPDLMTRCHREMSDAVNDLA